jgi:hypothetical protein
VNERPDPFDLLASMAASDRAGASIDLPLEPGADEHAEALLRRVTGGTLADRVPGQRPHTPRRTRRLVTAAAAVSVLGVGAAVAAVWTKQPADAATVLCYSSVDTKPDAIVGLTAAPDSTPLEQCAVPWTDGRLGRGEAPDLVACVGDLEATVVLPGDDSACGRLGWALAEPRTAAANVDARVAQALPGSLGECTTDLAAAQATIEGILADIGADAWTVEVAPGAAITAERPCAALAIDATTHVVTVVAVQPPPG